MHVASRTFPGWSTPPSATRLRCRGWAAAAVAPFLLGACERGGGSVTGPPAPPPNVQAYVVGEAARSLDAQGRFIFGLPSAPGDVAIISPESAGALAQAMVRTWGRYVDRSWEYQRGGPIDLDRLQLGERILYAETPYEVFPETYHPATRRHYGPMYLVPFMEGGEQVLTVGVSAYSTDLSIGSDGKVIRPVLGGGWFYPLGTSIDTTKGPTRFRPLSAEEAVQMAVAWSGARVTQVPRLTLMKVPYDPNMAQWRVELDRGVPVRNRRTGERVDVREVYVGPDRKLRVPRAEQPIAESVTYIAGPTTPGQARNEATLALRRREGFPLAFDEVVPDRAGGGS